MTLPPPARAAQYRFDSWTTDSGLPQNTVHSIVQTPDGYLWFTTFDGLVRFDGIRFTVFDRGNTKGILSNRFTALFVDSDGALWAGTEDSGLVIYRNGVFVPYALTDQSRRISEIYAIRPDPEGRPLISTLDGPLSLHDGKLTAAPPDYDAPNTRFYRAPSGTLWALDQHGVTQSKEGRVIKYAFKLDFSHDLYRHIAFCEDRQGGLWFGDYGSLYNLHDGAVTRYLPHHGLPRLPTFTVLRPYCEDDGGGLWVAVGRGNQNTSLGVMRLKDGRYTLYGKAEGLLDNKISQIFKDREGTIWIGTYGGLAQLKDGKFISYTSADGLAGDHVRSIYEDSEGVFWIGTYDQGLSRFHDGRFVNYRVQNGLFNNGVFQILEDQQGRFWISSNKGIYRVGKRELNDFAAGRINEIHCVAYGRADGMRNIECNGGRQPAGLKSRDGKLWFPTMDGVVVIDPEAVIVNELPLPVLIEQVTTDRSPLDISKDVVLEPGQDDVEIAYTAVSFIKPEQIKFKYRLEGKDDEWTDADTRRVAYYPYLPPGRYTFRIIAANQDGVWNLEGASIRIIVMAPFYERWWFLMACGGAVIAAALISFRARIAGLKKKQAAQEAFSRQLIGLQEQERKRIAAELHDSLSQNLVIIKNRALISLGDRDDAEQAFEQMEEISEAADQALSEVREIAHDLRPFQIDRLGLTRAIEAMVRRASTPELRLTASIDNLDGLLSPEMEINLYRIIQECISNIIKHSAASEAGVRVERVGQEIDVAVEDNGKGFTPAATAPGQSLNGSGFGLLGITERARILGSPVLIDSAPGHGCKLSFKLPLKDGKP